MQAAHKDHQESQQVNISSANKKGKKKQTDNNDQVVHEPAETNHFSYSKTLPVINHQNHLQNNNSASPLKINHSKQTNSAKVNQQNQPHKTSIRQLNSSSSSSVSVDSPQADHSSNNPSNQAKLLALKVRRMEIGGIENSSSNNNNNTNGNSNNLNASSKSINGNNNDTSLNDSGDKFDLFDHPPSKKLNMNNTNTNNSLSGSQQPNDESMQTNETAADVAGNDESMHVTMSNAADNDMDG